MTIIVKTKIEKSDFTLNVDLELPGLGITVLFGHSGCGKTTLLRAIAGLEKNANTLVKVNDSLWQQNQNFIPTHLRRVGFVFQEPRLFDHLSVLKNLEYGLKRVQNTDNPLTLDEVGKLLNVDPMLQRSVSGLSGGEKQRVAIARALLSSPKLLLMDEPLAALDHSAKQEILPYLEKLHRVLDLPILYVSHSADEVVHLADHLVVLSQGQVVSNGPFVETVSKLSNPMSSRDSAFSVVQAKIKEHDIENHITILELGRLQLRMPRFERPVGERVRLRIMAKDVSLSLSPAKQSSILNILPADIHTIKELSKGQVLIALTIEGQRVLSRISAYSLKHLDLSESNKIYAQIKGLAIIK